MVATVNHSSSDVYSSELNLSAVIQNIALTIGAMVGAANQGPLGPVQTANYNSYRALYGPSKPSLSKVHVCARDFFAKAGSGSLYMNRVVGAGYAYPGALLQYIPVSGTPTLKLTAFGQGGDPNPANVIDFETAGGATNLNQNLAYFYAIGPGTFYNQYAIDIISDNISVPSGVSATDTSNTVPGTLTAGNYQYQVTAIGALGETLPSTTAIVTVASGVTAGSVTINWSAVTGATGYRIYGRDSGGTLGLIAVVGSVTTYVDTGAITPSTAAPATSFTTSGLFTVRVYDLTQSATIPVETWKVSLAPNSDGFGQQTEAEEVINNQSLYIRVVNNYPYLTSTPPAITPLAKTTFSGGLDGAAVTASDIINGWDAFSNKDLISINTMINAGYADPAIHLAMDTLAHARKDSTWIGDLLPSQQTAAAAVAYRKLTLGLNSDRGLLIACDAKELDPDTNQRIWVPQSGFVAGCAAYTDSIANASYSPAGLNRGVSTTALELRYNYDKPDQDNLAANQVNYMRSKLGAGLYLAEQRTLATRFSALSFWSVRRIFDIMENAIQEALQYSVQEPNTLYTAQQINNMLVSYLEPLKKAGSIIDYAVVIDQSPDTVAQGILGVYVYIKPTLPINQIVLQTILTAQGANFTELAGQTST